MKIVDVSIVDDEEEEEEGEGETDFWLGFVVVKSPLWMLFAL